MNDLKNQDLEKASGGKIVPFTTTSKFNNARFRVRFSDSSTRQSEINDIVNRCIIEFGFPEDRKQDLKNMLEDGQEGIPIISVNERNGGMIGRVRVSLTGELLTVGWTLEGRY